MLVLFACASSTSGALAEASPAPATSRNPLPALQRFNDPRAMAVAHRGCWQKVPENSLASLHSCIRLGMDAAEIDIRTTKDGRLVLLHDVDLDRTTNLAGAVANYTWAELGEAKLREGKGGPGSRLTDERIATLSQALRLAKGRLILFIDTKCQGCGEAIRKAVESEAAQDWVIFIGSMSGEYRTMSGWSRDQTVVWINDCKSQPYFPQMTRCFDTFADGVRSFGGDRPSLFLSMSREPGFLTNDMDTPELRGIKPVVGAYIDYRSNPSDEQVLAESKRQWTLFLEAASPAIIGDFPEEMLELMRTLGKR